MGSEWGSNGQRMGANGERIERMGERMTERKVNLFANGEHMGSV